MDNVAIEEFYAQWRPGMPYAVWSETKDHVVARMTQVSKMWRQQNPMLVKLVRDSSRSGKHIWISFALDSHCDAGLRGMYISTNKIAANNRYKLHAGLSNYIKLSVPVKYRWEVVDF